MKILFITRGFPSEKDPMAGNYEAVQAKAIAQKGHQVSVLAISWFPPSELYKCTQLSQRTDKDINIYECGRPWYLIPRIFFPKWEKKFRQRLFDKVFRKYVKKEGMPDVVHAHIILYAEPAIILKEKYHIPFVITEHWTKMNVDNISPRLAYQAKAYQQADCVICVSKALSNNLKKHFDINSVIINNMVSDLFFQTSKIERNDNTFRFVAVGALRKNKRFDVLIDAFAKSDFSDNICLNIVGGGEEWELLDNQIQQLGISNQVKMLGVKTPEEVSDLLCRSDCYVLSSRLETFAIVVIEALAKGIPAIATISGGPETFLRPEDGLLVPKENVEELSKAMKYMVEHHKEYDADEIRQHCYNSFSQDVIADKIVEIYKQVMRK